MNSRVEVELQVGCRMDSIPRKAGIERWIGDTIRLSDDDAVRTYSVVVRIVDERESRTLNYRFRHKDKATNVLAFPAGDQAEMSGLPMQAAQPLGDLAICAPVVEREALEQGKTTAAHWGHLLIHGTLHLLGYDHQSDAEALQMERLETEILASRGIGDPYSAI